MIVFGTIFYALGNFVRKGDLRISITLLVIGIVVGIFYVKRQYHHSHPLLPVDLFRNSMYSMSIATSTCSFIAQNMIMIALPFLFLNNLNFSEITTGLLMTPMSIATMIVSPMAARYVERHNPGATAACGMAVFLTGVALLLFAGSNLTEWDIVWRMALCGVGFGMFQTPNNLVMVMATPVNRTGAAGGMQSTARLVGQTTGATLVSSIFALIAVESDAVSVCLVASIIFAACAGVLSYTRTIGHKKELHL